jgi:hypothetical protein
MKIRTIFDHANDFMDEDLKKEVEKKLSFSILDEKKDYVKKMFFVEKYSEAHCQKHGQDFYLF